jgi:hypothetical protein
MVEVRFQVHEETLPALYSAIEEISNEVGTRLESPRVYAQQDTLTRAARALGPLRAGISAAHAEVAARPENARSRRWDSPLGDPDYR